MEKKLRRILKYYKMNHGEIQSEVATNRLLISPGTLINILTKKGYLEHSLQAKVLFKLQKKIEEILKDITEEIGEK